MLEVHGEINQTPGNTYFDVSVPEGENLTKAALDKVFFRYYGHHIEYATYKKDGRQHYRVAAYKD